eukprot:1161468-Pelagomonas_calceolata.AAC.4
MSTINAHQYSYTATGYFCKQTRTTPGPSSLEHSSQKAYRITRTCLGRVESLHHSVCLGYGLNFKP